MDAVIGASTAHHTSLLTGERLDLAAYEIAPEDRLVGAEILELDLRPRRQRESLGRILMQKFHGRGAVVAVVRGPDRFQGNGTLQSGWRDDIHGPDIQAIGMGGCS